MMPQTKPRIPGEAHTDQDQEFMFILGDRVVGRVTADCANCAWNQGHPRWPAARLAFYNDVPGSSGLLPLTCIRVLNRQLQEAREKRMERERRN